MVSLQTFQRLRSKKSRSFLKEPRSGAFLTCSLSFS
nr:transcriptional regulatory protein PhlF [Pseudomonas sp.]